MKSFISLSLLVFLCATYAAKATDLAPMVLIQPGDTVNPAHADYGLIGDIILDFAAKRTARRIKGFHDASAGVDLIAEAQKEIACIGVEVGGPCRSIELFSGKTEDLVAKLTKANQQEVWLAYFIPMHEPQYYRLRVTLVNAVVEKSLLKPRRTMTAIYFAEPPADLLKEGKKSPDKLLEYWKEGETPRFFQEARRSFVEIKNMLTDLNVKLPVGAKELQGFESLTTMKEAAKSGRLHCGSGTGCSQARVYGDRDDRVWITMKSPDTRIAWSLISLGPNSYLKDANAMIYITVQEL